LTRKQAASLKSQAFRGEELPQNFKIPAPEKEKAGKHVRKYFEARTKKSRNI
jgi:hypothetical protein